MSINLELPTADGLKKLAPGKSRSKILTPMKQIQKGITANRYELMEYKKAPSFVPAGQSTQMIVGATGENDFQMMMVAEALYQNYDLKRVFYSAFVPVNQDSSLPALPGGPPFCGNTGCTRQTGSCVSMDFRRESCFPKLALISMYFWIQSVIGLCAIWNYFQWK